MYSIIIQHLYMLQSDHPQSLVTVHRHTVDSLHPTPTPDFSTFLIMLYQLSTRCNI